MEHPEALSQPQAGLVSVMMPAYNAEGYIRQAIQSVLDQRYQQWELIIVNDGSTDGTLQAAQMFDDARIRIFSQPNAGEAVARNLALEKSRGEYIAFLDADDLYQPEHLARAVAYLEQHPERDAVYTDGMYINPQGQPVEPLSSRRRGPFENDIFEAVLRASDVFGPPICIVLRQRAVQARSLRFDSEIVIGPDWDFFTRFSENNTFGYLPQINCSYRLHATSISVSTSQPRRRASLARCREKAIQLARFGECSLETRVYAFYDLLVELLTGLPERQEQVTRWAQFQQLPKAERARLFRLMANRAVLQVDQSRQAQTWYRQALALQPANPRNLLPLVLHAFSPAASRWLVRTRQAPLIKK